MNKPSICIVTPHTDMANSAQQVFGTNNLEIEIYQTVLHDVVNDIDRIEDLGCKVLISRGGCAELLRRNSTLPVVEIEVSFFDLFEALHPFSETDKKLGIIGFRSVISSCERMTKLLKIHSELLIIEDIYVHDIYSQVSVILRKIKHKKFDWIICDSVYQEYFPNEKINFTNISSGTESLLKAFETATNLIKAIEVKSKENLYLQTIFNHHENSLITVDDKGTIIHINKNAIDFFSIDQNESFISKTLKDIDQSLIPLLTLDKLKRGEKIFGTILDSHRGTLIVNLLPIMTDKNLFRVLFSIQTGKKVQKMEHNIRRHELAQRGLSATYIFKDFITKNLKMRQKLQLIEKYANTDATIMIYGESGTGKEMIAQSIHNASLRRAGPFVAVNCGAFAPQLLESELFGYVPGAFTGASAKGKIGLFELAHNGTIFLDEISELDRSLQSRLLRVLQEREVMRLGSDQIIPVNIRIVSASNHQLLSLVKKNKFRDDLYYRLNILKATPMPLRERKEDVFEIGSNLLTHFTNKYNQPPITLSNSLWALLEEYRWPGNVRQLSNIMERLSLSMTSSLVTVDDALLFLDDMEELNMQDTPERCSICNFTNGTFENIKLELIKYILKQENYNKSRVAKRLNVDRTSINRWLSKDRL